MDVAASVQAVTEEFVLKLARNIRSEFVIPNLCLAGGVALNCVANGRMLREGIFDDIWIQPAAGDAGGSWCSPSRPGKNKLENPCQSATTDAMKGFYLGPEFEQSEIEQCLKNADAQFEVLTEDELSDRTVEVLAQGCAVGWFNGRM